MNADHPQAGNIFGRLISYTPRPDRTALEDFCTEGLAWCLQNSQRFQKEFLRLIRLEFLKEFDGVLTIDTQQSYKSDGRAGRFDLTIKSESAPDANSRHGFFIAIESKIGSDFGQDQLSEYCRELKNRASKFNYCKLVTLTKWSEIPPFAHAHIRWSQVQEALAKIDVQDESRQISRQIIYTQFADFLAEKGMKPMHIQTINPEILSDYWKGMKFQEALETILKGLRQEKEIEFQSRRKPELGKDPDGTGWLGIYIADDLWAGFLFGNPDKGEFNFSMRVGKSFKGDVPESAVSVDDTLKPYLKDRPVKSDGWTYFNFDQSIDSNFNGNYEAIERWLANTTSKVQKLRETSKR